MKSKIVKSLSYANGPKPPLFLGLPLAAQLLPPRSFPATWASERLLSEVSGVGGTVGMIPL